MRVIDVCDDSFGTGERIRYTVELKENVLTDVMRIAEPAQKPYCYVMQCHDGRTAFAPDSDGDSVGNIEDFGSSEDQIIQFVNKYRNARKADRQNL